MTMHIKKVTQIEHHRNGVRGDPFHAVLFTSKEDGHKMLAMVFDTPNTVGVIDLDLIREHGVTFAENSFRGDEYEPELRHAITKAEGR
jgi:hypothetical protein